MFLLPAKSSFHNKHSIMANYTIKQYMKKLEKIEERLKSREIITKASGDVLAAMSKRIFVNGENHRGESFQYSTKPTYIDPKISPRSIASFQKGKTGNPISTGYFSGGYKQFKRAIGRQTSQMNWVLSGALQTAFNNSLKLKNVFTVVFELRRRGDVSREIDKKYGRVFKLSQKERALFFKSVKKQYLKILRGDK